MHRSATRDRDDAAFGREDGGEHGRGVLAVGLLQRAAASGEDARRAVAARGDEARAVGAEGDGLHPIRMLSQNAPGFPARGIEEADGAVRAAGGEAFSIRAEGYAQRGVRQIAKVAHLGLRIDERDCAPLRGRASGDCEQASARLPRERGDALGQAADAPRERAVGDVPDRDLVVAAHGELGAVGVEGKRGDGRGPRVMIRRGAQESFAGEFHQRTLRRAAIVGGTLANPALDECDLRRGQRVGFLRHAVVRVRFHEEAVEFGVARLAGGERREIAVAGMREPRESIEAVAALRRILIVASRAPALEERRDLAAKAHRPCIVGARSRGERQGEEGGECKARAHVSSEPPAAP